MSKLPGSNTLSSACKQKTCKSWREAWNNNKASWKQEENMWYLPSNRHKGSSFIFSFASQFTETFLTERDKQSKWSGIPQLLLKLYATSHLHSDFIECQNILKVTVRGLGGTAFRVSRWYKMSVFFLFFRLLFKIACFYCISYRKFGKFRKSAKKKIKITNNPPPPRDNHH